jgi:hypothetical protein
MLRDYPLHNALPPQASRCGSRCDGSGMERQPQKELPQAQPPPAFGLSISKPCFSMVSV